MAPAWYGFQQRDQWRDGHWKDWREGDWKVGRWKEKNSEPPTYEAERYSGTATAQEKAWCIKSSVPAPSGKAWDAVQDILSATWIGKEDESYVFEDMWNGNKAADGTPIAWSCRRSWTRRLPERSYSIFWDEDSQLLWWGINYAFFYDPADAEADGQKPVQTVAWYAGHDRWKRHPRFTWWREATWCEAAATAPSAGVEAIPEATPAEEAGQPATLRERWSPREVTPTVEARTCTETPAPCARPDAEPHKDVRPCPIPTLLQQEAVDDPARYARTVREPALRRVLDLPVHLGLPPGLSVQRENLPPPTSANQCGDEGFWSSFYSGIVQSKEVQAEDTEHPTRQRKTRDKPAVTK